VSGPSTRPGNSKLAAATLLRGAASFTSLAIRAGLLVAALCQPSLSQTLPEILSHARQASGYDKLTGTLELHGRATVYGLSGPLVFTLAPDGRFRWTADLPIPAGAGYDGREWWEVDQSRVPVVHSPGDPGAAIPLPWILTGRWTDPNSGVEASLAPGSNSKRIVLDLRMPGANAEGQLTLDRAAFLPVSFKTGPAHYEVACEFQNYRKEQGLNLAHRWNASQATQNTSFVIADASVVSQVSFAAPDPPADTRFDPKLAAAVDTRASNTGQLLVRPRLNGKDVGWFLLDSGAGGMVITPEVADRLGMESIGKIGVLGIGGPLNTILRRGATFELGGMSIDGLLFSQVDMTPLAKLLGVDAFAGVVGYDVLARAVVELDPASHTMTMFDPAQYQSPAAEWQPISLAGKIPQVRATYEGGRQGTFTLDLGSNAGVMFNAPAVTHNHLIDSRATQVAYPLQGVGDFRTEWRRGTLEWIQLGSQRIETIQAGFVTLAAPGTPLNDPRIDGSLGTAALGRLKVIFNYPSRKIAFLSSSSGMQAHKTLPTPDSLGTTLIFPY